MRSAGRLPSPELQLSYPVKPADPQLITTSSSFPSTTTTTTTAASTPSSSRATASSHSSPSAPGVFDDRVMIGDEKIGQYAALMAASRARGEYSQQHFIVVPEALFMYTCSCWNQA